MAPTPARKRTAKAPAPSAITAPETTARVPARKSPAKAPARKTAVKAAAPANVKAAVARPARKTTPKAAKRTTKAATPTRKRTTKAPARARSTAARTAPSIPRRGIQAPDAPAHLTMPERIEVGREARRSVPRSSHGGWEPASGRRDPVTLLEEQNAIRVPWLVPVRHARMRVSPFTFYRGTARIMAADLASTPTSGLQVQLGGDAHLSNFGAYASPERELVFDANDFDETLPGPWEWDVKRLAASFTVAGQHLGIGRKAVRKATATAVRSYREAMAEYAPMGYLDVWYDEFTVDDLQAANHIDAEEMARRVDRFSSKARKRTSLQALAKLTERVDGRYRIRSQPPLLVPLRELPDEASPAALEEVVRVGFEQYKETLPGNRRVLLERFTPVDMALKVVGVGSVGTRCFIMLLEGRDNEDPLFLQIKEAGPSVLEEHLGASVYPNSGQRVVEGQQLAQAQSDIFLGWTEGRESRQFYVRQLRDWKGSVETEGATPNQLEFYARLCGRTLARGHARSGDAASISAYLGKGDAFDRAVTDFSEAYAQQNLLDFGEFVAAIEDGRLECAESEST
ncbi:MAG: DUF2252 family protein [Actinomycetota bacterium]